MPITMMEAREIASQYIKQREAETGVALVSDDHSTLEETFGWVFFYCSKRVLETGDFRDAMGGNAPIVVMRSDGAVHVTGTAYPIEHYLQRFRRSGDTSG